MADSKFPPIQAPSGHNVVTFLFARRRPIIRLKKLQWFVDSVNHAIQDHGRTLVDIRFPGLLITVHHYGVAYVTFDLNTNRVVESFTHDFDPSHESYYYSGSVPGAENQLDLEYTFLAARRGPIPSQERLYLRELCIEHEVGESSEFTPLLYTARNSAAHLDGESLVPNPGSLLELLTRSYDLFFWQCQVMMGNHLSLLVPNQPLETWWQSLWGHLRQPSNWREDIQSYVHLLGRRASTANLATLVFNNTDLLPHLSQLDALRFRRLRGGTGGFLGRFKGDWATKEELD
ncbi:hypothetical protein BKA69DRAFT_1128013 [Paraphysoderma sedebokerense]|nr:hypothetical protein BKA69DRAFT_1128013 [Paraphysoderma sedebokerense]